MDIEKILSTIKKEGYADIDAAKLLLDIALVDQISENAAVRTMGEKRLNQIQEILEKVALKKKAATIKPQAVIPQKPAPPLAEKDSD